MDNRLNEGVWALLESSRNDGVTLDEVETMMKSAEKSLGYFETLIKRGYVTMSGITHDNGAAIAPKFRLVRLTGPKAPYLDDSGYFVDPNLPRRITGASDIYETAVPRTGAVIVAHAMKLTEPFTKDEIVEITGLHKQASFLTAHLRNLAARGWLERLEGKLWRFKGVPPDMAYMLDVLKAGASSTKPVSIYAEKDGYDGSLQPSSQGFAVDILRASGWRITRAYSGGPHTKTLYYVEKP